MSSSINEVCKLANVSKRTLRYYDEIGLLKPTYRNDVGYRYYDKDAILLLQQILLYRDMGLSLEEIKKIVHAPHYNIIQSLKKHHLTLQNRLKNTKTALSTIEKTILYLERSGTMSEKDFFRGINEKIKKNEKQYGKEIREKYGIETVDASYQHMKKLTKSDQERLQQIEQDMIALFLEGLKNNNPTGKEAQKACELHKKWLLYYWPSYSKEAHLGLVRMYLEDERFTAYYDKHQEGLTAFLAKCMEHYLQ